MSKRMKGINYITNERGERTAVVIDLKKYESMLGDFLDGVEAASRVKEPEADFRKSVEKVIKLKQKRAVQNRNKKNG